MKANDFQVRKIMRTDIRLWIGLLVLIVGFLPSCKLLCRNSTPCRCSKTLEAMPEEERPAAPSAKETHHTEATDSLPNASGEKNKSDHISKEPVSKTACAQAEKSAIEFKKELDKTENSIRLLDRFKGKLDDSAGILLEYFAFHKMVKSKLGELLSDIQMRSDERSLDFKPLYERCVALAEDFEEATLYIEAEISRISKDKIDLFMAKEKSLEEYRHDLNDLSAKP
ncbi:MAG: hypothetical protein KJ645_04915 [Planctomycetes bacterium]|nr:hypothetical protein [Planctomycetota bacterium]